MYLFKYYECETQQGLVSHSTMLIWFW